MKRAVGLPVLLLAAALAAACSDDVQDIYSSYPAFFRFSPVTAASQLYTAVSNPGQFCTVTFQNGQYYIFTDARGTSTSWSVTAQQQYGRPVFISGFIVGTPAVMDMSGRFPLTAYDLVCPHCYETSAITRPVSFDGETQMACPRCGNSYDLNNGGMPVSGPATRTLYRYHVAYSQGTQTLIIQN